MELTINEETELTEQHSNEELLARQLDMLNGLLKKGAITKAQFDKSSGDLIKKMKIEKNI